MVELFEMLFYFVAVVVLICLYIREHKRDKEPSKCEILLEHQNDLFSQVNNTLVGIDTRLREIQENKGFSNDN